MKFIHTSDLHIGKRLYEAPMLDDQIYILDEIISITRNEKPDAFLISGDIYDKPVPPAEAVTVFDRFVTELASLNVSVYIISGNHDSAQRLDFMSELLRRENVYICGSFKGKLETVAADDEFGRVYIHLLPFIKPSSVRRFAPEQPIESCEEAVKFVLDNAEIDYGARNILISHQFITGSSGDGSEEMSIGGLDNVSFDIFSRLDYTALGHIHRAQKVGRDNIRYSGTPLKYSFSEEKYNKSVTVVELFEKGNITINEIPLTPMRDMRCIKGTYDELTDRRRYSGTNTDDYIKATLTDEDDIPDALMKLRTVYPNILALEYDNARTRAGYEPTDHTSEEDGAPIDMFSALYEYQYGSSMSNEQVQILTELINKVWEEEK